MVQSLNAVVLVKFAWACVNLNAPPPSHPSTLPLALVRERAVRGAEGTRGVSAISVYAGIGCCSHDTAEKNSELLSVGESSPHTLAAGMLASTSFERPGRRQPVLEPMAVEVKLNLAAVVREGSARLQGHHRCTTG